MQSSKAANKNHTIDFKLLTVNGGFDSFDNKLIILISCELSMQFDFERLPILRFTIINHFGDVPCVEISDEIFENVCLADCFLFVVIVLEAF